MTSVTSLYGVLAQQMIIFNEGSFKFNEGSFNKLALSKRCIIVVIFMSHTSPNCDLLVECQVFLRTLYRASMDASIQHDVTSHYLAAPQQWNNIDFCWFLCRRVKV